MGFEGHHPQLSNRSSRYSTHAPDDNHIKHPQPFSRPRCPKEDNGMTLLRGLNLQPAPINDETSFNTPASRTRLSGGSRFRKGAGPRRRAVWGRCSPSGRWSARKAVFRKHPAGSGFPCVLEPATVSAPFHCGAGSLAIRKTRKAAMAHSRRIRLLGATMISSIIHTLEA